MTVKRQRPAIRELAHLFSVFHNIIYYAEELAVFQERGIEQYWHGYMAFRSAPLGRVNAATVVATFYNFSPALVDEAIPAAWEHVSPTEAIALREHAVLTALRRVFPAAEHDGAAASVADRTIQSLSGQPTAGRALFAANLALPVPDDPILRLWHSASLWREFRGDGHNVALAAEQIDGIECHVLLAGKGVANQRIIETIRGWDSVSWTAAVARLVGRGLVGADGKLTTAGSILRRDIEATTDRLASGPMDELGGDAVDLIATMTPLVDQLLASGIVPDRWPPPKLTDRRPRV